MWIMLNSVYCCERLYCVFQCFNDKGAIEAAPGKACGPRETTVNLASSSVLSKSVGNCRKPKQPQALHTTALNYHTPHPPATDSVKVFPTTAYKVIKELIAVTDCSFPKIDMVVKKKKCVGRCSPENLLDEQYNSLNMYTGGCFQRLNHELILVGIVRILDEIRLRMN